MCVYFWELENGGQYRAKQYIRVRIDVLGLLNVLFIHVLLALWSLWSLLHSTLNYLPFYLPFSLLVGLAHDVGRLWWRRLACLLPSFILLFSTPHFRSLVCVALGVSTDQAVVWGLVCFYEHIRPLIIIRARFLFILYHQLRLRLFRHCQSLPIPTFLFLIFFSLRATRPAITGFCLDLCRNCAELLVLLARLVFCWGIGA